MEMRPRWRCMCLACEPGFPHPKTRSVWSARSLLPLLDGANSAGKPDPKLGAEAMQQALEVHRSGELRGVVAAEHLAALIALAVFFLISGTTVSAYYARQLKVAKRANDSDCPTCEPKGEPKRNRHRIEYLATPQTSPHS